MFVARRGLGVRGLLCRIALVRPAWYNEIHESLCMPSSTSDRRPWTRPQLLLAFTLYCQIPFSSISNRNPEIIKLASLLDRSASALSWKLANFAHLDPSLRSRKIGGASHIAKLDRQIWNEFHNNWDALFAEAEQVRATLAPTSPALTDAAIPEKLPEGATRAVLVESRVHQDFFRRAVLTAYRSACCITGLAVPELLIASHIIPWAKDESNRTNPRNGLCLNALHDRAFDCGLIAIGEDNRVVLSSRLATLSDPASTQLLLQYRNQPLHLPERFVPAPEFLAYHRDHIFQP